MTLPERHRRARRATLTGIAGNSVLFAVKATIGIVSGSIALLSDAFNSLVDVVASVAIWYSVHVADREADADHPFGHQRAETIAALAVAIFTAILGFEIGRSAVERLIAGPRPIAFAGWALAALVFSMAGNLALARYLRRRGEELESPAILANAVECENDIWTSLAALIGLAAAVAGMEILDPVAGILVGIWIVWGGYRFGRKNIDYLMGKSPGQELVDRIRALPLGIPGVRGVHDVRAHYVGHRIHVEVHVEVDQELPTRRSHDVGGSVRAAIERLPGVDRAFIHLDPVLGSTAAVETLARIERAASDAYSAYARQHAERPPFAALWTALAAAAQARADRLDVVRRLKGAGWHFADDEVAAERIDRRWARARAAAAEARDGGPSVEGALELALELEGGEARADFARATTPRDPTVRASLEGSSPPPPASSAMLERARAALESLGAGPGSDQLRRLARELAGGEEAPGG
ncbi:MAG TPA: cation diffusion facilitator family transporter [Gemmatimonadota bacterium]|nr:cation diffusion facilitator family transporter [Gemmatimonadota bacterium]